VTGRAFWPRRDATPHDETGLRSGGPWRAIGGVIRDRMVARVALGCLASGLLIVQRADGQQPSSPRPPVALRYAAAGSYEGRLRGDTSYLVQGDSVSERIECTITMNFREDGTVTYDAGRYLYRRIYSKRTQTGYLKRIAETYSDGGRNDQGVTSRLAIWMTPAGLVQRAMWAPAVEVPGTSRSEVWYTDHAGNVQRKQILEDRRVTIFCDAVVLWRLRSGNGPGMSLNGEFGGRDVRAGRQWINTHVKWFFRPISRG
jgi:hypothetical protein